MINEPPHDKTNILVSKYIFQENYRLVMYDIDIKDALYFIEIRVVVLEILVLAVRIYTLVQLLC